MSHVSIGKGRIQDTAQDLAALRLACEELGLVFCEGQQTYKWYGRWMRDFSAASAAHLNGIDPKTYGTCEHAIRLPWTLHEEETYSKAPGARPYEIGLVRMADGSFALALDHWSGGPGVDRLLAKVGDGQCTKLMQLVNQHKIILETARQKGATVKKIERLANGKTHVVLGFKTQEKL